MSATLSAGDIMQPSGDQRRGWKDMVTTIVARDVSLDGQLKFAIANKRLVQLSYGGSLRVAEPHDYGIQKGKTRLLIYQRRGSVATTRKSADGWRLLDVSKIENCRVLDDTFSGSRGEPHQHHYVWDVLYARVASGPGFGSTAT